MKLYYAPGACSLAVHIALSEIGADYDLEKVDLATKKTETGADFTTVNPLGYVPVVEFDGGETLWEAPALLQYLADANPQAGLAPANGTIDRVRLQQLLNFTASELHKSFSPLFKADAPQGAAREAVMAKVASRLDFVERTLSDGRPYLLGDTYSVADIYAFVVANWAGPSGISLDRWSNVKDHVARVAARPRVVAAMQREGLLH